MPENNTADILDKTEPEYFVVHYEIDSSLVFKPALAVSIGRLTPQELEKFKKRNNIEEFTEERINEILKEDAQKKGDAIQFLPPKPKYFLLPKTTAHDTDEGIEYFEAFSKYEEARKDGKHFSASACKRLKDCARSADVIRMHTRKLPLTSSVPNDSSPDHYETPRQIGRDEWILQTCGKIKCGLTVATNEWNKLPEEARKQIDKKKYTPTNPNTVSQSLSRSRKKKMKKIVE